MPYIRGYKLDTSYNIQGKEKRPCICCAKKYPPFKRVDTIDLFNVEESFCGIHWFEHIVKENHICFTKLE